MLWSLFIVSIAAAFLEEIADAFKEITRDL
jgi:hypothetical protein